MGDIIMMTPALHALKKTFNCRISLLTSSTGALITPHISCIDETIIFDLPWIKYNHSVNSLPVAAIIEKLRSYHFDGAIISTVYSQNPLPAALLAYEAQIPLRAAYCRENPYELLTDWIPDKEPYSFIQHQVKRELQLFAKLGARTNDETLSLHYNKTCYNGVLEKLAANGITCRKPWIIVHPGVSEDKRKYPDKLWIKMVQQLSMATDQQLLITGSANEQSLAESIIPENNIAIHNVAGLFSIEEFICLVHHACVVISVNTATIHIAAATQTPVVALYALTNPQHIPWKTQSCVLPFSVPERLQSNNQVIQHVIEKYKNEYINYPEPADVITSALSLLQVKTMEHKHYKEII